MESKRSINVKSELKPIEIKEITPTGNITVYTKDIIRQIPNTLFGANVEWTQNGNDIFNPETKTDRPELVTLSKDLGVSLIRFPGGGFSDAYHWKNGIGDLETRPTTPNYPGGPSFQHLFGTKEALDFANKIGGELLITVNVGSGTAEEAAHWVAYINGINGLSLCGARVNYWEIGNELYMKSDYSGGTMPPEEYALKAQEFITAMKNIDPSIKIGIIGGLNYGRYNVVDYPNWNEIVLSKLSPIIDFISVHNSYAPVVVEETGVTPEMAYKAMLAAPVLIEQNLKDIEKQIELTSPDRKDKISIAVTEWGPMFHSLPSSKWVDHPKTLGSALFVSDMFRVFMNNPKVEIANYFKLTEQIFMGLIGQKDNVYKVKASYLAFLFYKKFFNGAVVKSEVTSSTFNSQGVGVVDAVNNVPYLTSCVSVDPITNKLYLMVVNKHFTKSIYVDINLTELTSINSGIVRVLTGGSLDAHTGTELLEIPGIEWAKQYSFDENIPFESELLETISINETPLENPTKQFKYSFSPHSITNIEFNYIP